MSLINYVANIIKAAPQQTISQIQLNMYVVHVHRFIHGNLFPLSR